MKYADKCGARFSAVMGDDEMERGAAALKNMDTGESCGVRFRTFAEAVKSMTERGVVTKVKGGRATVEFDRKSACDSCHMCAVTKDGMKVKIVIENTLLTPPSGTS